MHRVAAVLLGTLLAGCSQSLRAIPTLPGAAGSSQSQTPQASGYKVLYAFQNGDDAGYPYAPLIALDAELYGTTYGGGGGYDWGTVFKIDTAGKERVLYRFKAGNDGAHPYAGLTALNGELYGTTYQGGTSGAGTVFKISTSGVERVIYSFKGGDDGEYPYGRLVVSGGELYGTTYQGGGSGSVTWGTVFKISPSGTEHVLYRFKAGDDGAHPYAGLTAVHAILYGTTYQGGTSGAGTVFRITTSGSERVIYSFKGARDGQYPYGGLLYFKGKLYGTTYQGGVSPGWGVVYDVTPAGRERVLYRFKAGNDGAHPQFTRLIAVNGALYGTTYQGGASGAGTIFKLTSAGESVLYSFKGNDDGQYPYAGLLNLSGTLYGTTYQGGADDAGTVFKIAP